MHQTGVAEHQAAGRTILSLPLSLPACLPLIWSRVLFPGAPAAPVRGRWLSMLVLVLVPGLLLYPCMGFLLFEPDEGRYAEIPREMLLRGEWVVPLLQGEPYLDKPPLLYWLVMCSYQLLGVHDWSARLVPALAVHGCVLAVYLIGRRSLGERAAFWGAFLLSLAPGFVSVGRLLVLDGLLAFWVTLALLAALEGVRGERLRRGWWLLATLACGLGVLTKGPVAVLLLVPPFWAYRWLTGSRCSLGWKAWLVFTAVVVAVALPWYGAVCARAPAFAPYFFWEHNVVRFLAPFDHIRPVWFYGPIVLGGLLPATCLLVHLLGFLFSGEVVVASRRCPELGYMLLSGCWCVGFFSLSGCKLPTYVLPAFPPLALALGYYVANSPWQRSRWTWAAVGLALVVLGVGHYVAVPWYARHRSPMSRPAELMRYCGDRQTPVVCYPRNCDSVSFYVGRDDLRSFRSKETHLLVRFLQDQPRTVVVFTHRHSLQGLGEALQRFAPELCLTNAMPLFGSARLGPDGMCHLAVVERQARLP